MSKSVTSLHRYKVASAGTSNDSTIQRSNNSTVLISNRQRTRKINPRLLKAITEGLLSDLNIGGAELGISLVAAREMTLVNETFLRHKGSTDVITFDYAEIVAQASRLRSKSLERESRGRYFMRRAFHLRGRGGLAGEEVQDNLAVGNRPLHRPRHFASARIRRPSRRRAPQDEAGGKPQAGRAFQEV